MPTLEPRVWFIHIDRLKSSQELLSALASAAVRPITVESANARTEWQKNQPVMVLQGVASGLEKDSLELLHWIRQKNKRIPLLVFAAESSEELVIAALRAGATDFFRYPWSSEEISQQIRRSLLDLHEFQETQRITNLAGEEFVGETAVLSRIRQQVQLVASSNCNVLVTGETGTGKELIANLIHKSSFRSRNRFVCLNCAAIPESLLESELFGHERGAFTGAHESKAGRLEHANQGTIFLDEIGDMPQSAQAKLLRVIESRELQRLGDMRDVKIDVRVIAATNQNLEQRVESGQFRADLYYRLNVFRLELPPLREHPQDIPLLVRQFVESWNQKSRKHMEGLTAEAMGALMTHRWPGNVRELRNVLESTFVASPGPMSSFADLPQSFMKALVASKSSSNSERDKLLSALFATNWNKTRAAEALKWSRMTVYRKIAHYRIDLESSEQSPASMKHCAKHP